MVPSFLWGSRTIRMLQNLFPNVIKNEKITAKTYNSADRNPEMGIVLYSNGAANHKYFEPAVCLKPLLP